MQRPSHRELAGKHRTATQLVDLDRWAAANPVKLAADFRDLDLFLADEQQSALRESLAELAPEHYRGGRPPARSYEPKTKGAEMFAFSWSSRRFGRKMYLKFAVVGETGDQMLYVYSLHVSREKEGKR